MKKLIFTAAMLLMVASIFTQSGKNHSEGTLICKVELKLPEQMSAMSSNFQTELKVLLTTPKPSLITPRVHELTFSSKAF